MGGLRIRWNGRIVAVLDDDLLDGSAKGKKTSELGFPDAEGKVNDRHTQV
jgi:hypothetical protein